MPLFPRYDGPALMEQMCSVENLTLAWRRVRSNIQVARRRHSAGVDAVTVRDFEADWARQMTQLADELRGGTYRPLPPRHVRIPKRSGGERAIAILTVRDRVAQRAVQQVLEPIFDPLLLDCSYGCRPLVGVPDAVARVARYAEQGLTWVVDADIRAYFDSIDQRILLGLLRQRIDDVPLLRLIAQWLEAGMLTQPDLGDVEQASRGPLGLLARGGGALRQAIATVVPAANEALIPDPVDPYGAARWEAPGVDTSVSPVNSLGTALLLARPVLNAGKAALPYIQRIGTRRLALAGAVAMGAVAAGEVIARVQPHPRGTPQGGALSPLLANIYLHPFDVALTSQGLRLVRFMDDFVILCASEGEALRARDLVARQLTVLRLDLNPEKTRIVRYADGLEFLGQALVPRRKGPHLPEGITSFTEAEEALRTAAGRVRRSFQKKSGR